MRMKHCFIELSTFVIIYQNVAAGISVQNVIAEGYIPCFCSDTEEHGMTLKLYNLNLLPTSGIVFKGLIILKWPDSIGLESTFGFYKPINRLECLGLL